MKQPLYIKSACAISPQHTFRATEFPLELVSYDDGKMFVIDPDYTKYVSPVAIRRMSRLIKRGIAAGMQSLEDAGVQQPDAIITGTARGSVTDMERFLTDMIKLNEEALNPTFFIQSTYNSVNGWLALQTKATCYNQTYVHRGFSLELSLFDAQLLLADTNDIQNILVGGYDELTPEYFFIRDKSGYYKKEIPASLSLLQHSDTAGSIAGEGAAFFVVSNEQGDATCAIYGIQMLTTPTYAELAAATDTLLSENRLTKEDLDVLLYGINGDSRYNHLTHPFLENTSGNTTVATYKQLCGEYDTASGFALWLAQLISKTQEVPKEVVYRSGTSASVKNMLICNITIAGNVSLILVKSI